MMHEAVYHSLAVAVILLLGLPSNAAVIWIYTRKDSAAGSSKFPILFAIIDLIACLVAVPLHPFVKNRGFVKLVGFQAQVDNLYQIVSFAVMNGYLTTLLMATIDKLSAVMWPFKYRQRQKPFFKASTAIIIGWLLVAECMVLSARLIDNVQIDFAVVYIIITVLEFLALIVLYITILVKILQSTRKTQKVWTVQQPTAQPGNQNGDGR